MSREENSPSAPPPGWRRAPIWRVLAAQMIGGLLALGGAIVLNGLGGPSTHLFLMLAIQGVLAAGLGHLMGLAPWWIPAHMVLPLAAASGAYLDLPSWIYLIVFIVLLLVFWNSPRDRVPLYLTNRRTWEAIAGLLPAAPGFRFLDLGGGIGGTLLFLARRRPEGRFRGIESAPLPFALAWLRLRLSGLANIRLIRGDFWAEDLSAEDLVYAFLSPEPMPALMQKAIGEMKPGAILISNSFAVPGFAPERIIEVGDKRGTRLLVWHPAEKLKQNEGGQPEEDIKADHIGDRGQEGAGSHRRVDPEALQDDRHGAAGQTGDHQIGDDGQTDDHPEGGIVEPEPGDRTDQ